ncbi:MAG: glucoamylase family protein [Chitinophagaceae bacterium]
MCKAYLSVIVCLISVVLLAGCSKGSSDNTPPAALRLNSWQLNGQTSKTSYTNVSVKPDIRFSFSAPVSRSSAQAGFSIKDAGGTAVNHVVSFERSDSVVVLSPAQPLLGFTSYKVAVNNALKSAAGGALSLGAEFTIVTSMDSSDKFARISDEALLDLVQRQTFKYFWDFGHPVSGMARERNTSGETVTTGGTGFGVMAMVAAIHRAFITRTEGLVRIQKIVDFLKGADKFKGAFPHWLNGSTGKVQPFSAKDNGADLVETSFLMQGLLTARQYFDRADAAETALRSDINALWNAVEWDWFTKEGENVLYWHWSPNFGWDMNHRIQGWNEALVTYVLAAASPTHSISKTVYDAGWARNGAMRNGASYYGHQLPLGPSHGGPLFFAHYSFLGINPKDLTDAYANYWQQNRAHSLIHYEYAKANPKGFAGYSSAVWGLTASDDNKVGYLAHEPANDNGVVAPTAALSSMPYTPEESMKALRFYYYVLGDKLWKEYGFVDAFNLTDGWFANSFLAIDQGPIIVMIENHRSGLLWNLFMSAPEVKAGLRKLGFQSPHL